MNQSMSSIAIKTHMTHMTHIYANKKYLEASLTLEEFLHTAEHKALRMQTPSANTLHLRRFQSLRKR